MTRPTGPRVLVVDDEESIRASLRMILEFERYRVDEAANGREALRRVMTRPPAAVLLDIKMPEMDGLSTLSSLRERGHDMPVVMISGHGDIAAAVEATRLGAYDFLEKPLERDRVLLALRNAVERQRLRDENRELRRAPSELVGESPAMKELRATIGRAAPTPATVLITGESGVGKELVARAIHAGSQRSEMPLVQVNCAAIPDELIESELFGHEKGAFTGAVRRQVGKFTAADGGTIFLDEIGDMSARTQAKVLRALQSGEIEPVGARMATTVDVRVVAATHRDLPAEIEAGRFREDLFYRLNVVPVHAPPLRERLEDLPLLVEHFIERFAIENNYRQKSLTQGAIRQLQAMPWRGNVRELKNLLERVLILSPGDRIDRAAVLGLAGSVRGGLSEAILALPTLREFRESSERMYLAKKLEEHGWNVTRTAKAIGTPRSNLYKKMEQYGLRREAAP